MTDKPRTPRQTLSYLRGLLEAHGLRPKNKLGQSFLIDLNFLDFMVRQAELSRADLVIEVGSGTGSLTAKLAELAGHVLSVEIDPGFFALAQENTEKFDNVTLLLADILEKKSRLNPEVLQHLERLWQSGKWQQLKLVSNLPFVVATPVIVNFLLSELPLQLMLVTIQWELAARLEAQSGTKDYSAVSVIVQALADVQVLRRMPPQVFWPRPKVDSALVRIIPRPDKRAAIKDLAWFHRLVRDIYLHRRKNLRSALEPLYQGQLTREQLDGLLRQHGYDPHARAETLSVAEHIRLCEILPRYQSGPAVDQEP
ncbi:Ribosomal RNA small subunit methyltransferase A [bacterium HR36]|uniref:Ribosomal RNA small subunit methyltransferase A n=1 Tax=uncultured Planctomycetota bacterium TaxID=120965 RepID=H5SLX7_9BACT|nr:dimethyladenosine transferase [uncultured Planctomycetota bacterium]BAL57163.1 dimethyladenosine transferase [uncultured Planctomycetota bacterium]GBD35691.1 Ribosomal RNA small subunit methyltransferase A [bacterium HR36]